MKQPYFLLQNCSLYLPSTLEALQQRSWHSHEHVCAKNDTVQIEARDKDFLALLEEALNACDLPVVISVKWGTYTALLLAYYIGQGRAYWSFVRYQALSENFHIS